MGESGRPLWKRLAEHKKLHGSNITAVGNHTLSTGHTMKWDEVRILNTETRLIPRKIKESIEIKKLKPEINDSLGFSLSPLYTPLILNNSARSRPPVATSRRRPQSPHTSRHSVNMVPGGTEI